MFFFSPMESSKGLVVRYHERASRNQNPSVHVDFQSIYQLRSCASEQLFSNDFIL